MKKNTFIALMLLIISLSSCSTEEAFEDTTLHTHLTDVELAYPTIQGEALDLKNGTHLEKIHDEYVLSGDILLAAEQMKQLSHDNQSSHTHERTGLSSLARRWTNCKVYYSISSSLPNQSRVHDAIAHWEANYNIDFILRTNQNNYIEFVSSTGCSSFLGMIGGRQEIRLASGCTTGNTIHEIGHALGFLHEQQRADRDNSITI